MNRLWLIAAILVLGASVAWAAGSNMLLHVGSSGNSGGAPATNFILLVDGASFILQTDGTSKICLAGGC